MKPQAALEGTEGGIELHAVAVVDLDVALVVLPGDTELDDALGDGDDLQGGPVLRVALEEGAVLEREDELCWAADTSSSAITRI